MKWFERALYWSALVVLVLWVYSIHNNMGIAATILQSQANIDRIQVEMAVVNEARLRVLEGMVVVGGTMNYFEYRDAVTRHAEKLMAELRVDLESR